MKNKLVFSAILLFIISNNAFAQKTYTGNEAADWVHSQRNIADPLVDTKSAPADIEKAVNILEQTITFMDSLPIRQSYF